MTRGQPDHDRLFKVHQLIDMIVPKFRQVFSTRKEVAIDGMTIAFNGRSVLKQNSAKKSDKWGSKLSFCRSRRVVMFLIGHFTLEKQRM